MQTDHWGPSAWRTLHAFALAYPESGPTRLDRDNFRSFVTYFGRCLPCSSCRVKFRSQAQLDDLEHALGIGREPLFNWTVHFHNRVNGVLGKPLVSPSEARDLIRYT